LARFLQSRKGKGQPIFPPDFSGCMHAQFESGYVFQTSFRGIEIVNTAVTIRIRTFALLHWKKFVQSARSALKKRKKSLSSVCEPNKTRGQPQKTGKSVDALVAVSLQRRFTQKFHPHHNHS
jgi:hypothetical protein